MILHRWLRSQMLRHQKSEDSAEARGWTPLLQSLSQVLQDNETQIHRLEHGLEGMRHENQQLYAELEAERFKLQTVLDSVGSGVLITDPEGRMVFASPLAESLLGWLEGELTGKSLGEFFDAGQGRLKLAAGEWRHFDCRLQPMHWGERVLGQVLAFRPVPERLESPQPTLFGRRLALLGSHRALALLPWLRDRGAAALAFDRPEDFLEAAERASQQNLGFQGLLADCELSSDEALQDQISRLEELPTLVWLVDDEQSASAGRLRLPLQETALLALLDRWRDQDTATYDAVTPPPDEEESSLDRELRSLMEMDEPGLTATQAEPPEPDERTTLLPPEPAEALPPEPAAEALPPALPPDPAAEALPPALPPDPAAEALPPALSPEPAAEALPVLSETGPAAETAAPPEADAPPTEPEKLRVLIVEDEIISRTILEQCVRSMGHECLAASSGDQAWAMYQKNTVDVIISDWMMPGLTGPELCQAIRQSAGAQPKFILLTALSEESQLQDSSSVGVDFCLRKPVNPDEIASLLHPLRTTA